MSRQEYSDPSAVSIDAIEKAVDDIEIAVGDIDLIVTEIQSTDLANLEQNIYNPLNYDMFNVSYLNSAFPNNLWTEVYSAIGEGYIDTALFMDENVSTNVSFRITVDGNVIHNVTGNNNNATYGYLGFMSMSAITSDGASVGTPKTIRPFQQELLSDGRVDGIFNGIMNDPNVYNYSLKRPVMMSPDKLGFKVDISIEAKVVALNHRCTALIIGGIKK